MIVLAAILLIAQTPPVAAAQRPSPALANDPITPVFVLTYRQGPAWIEGQPMHKQRLGPHLRYMQKLLADGRLIAGGPITGENGGMAIVRAASLAEAKAILAADPAVISGVFAATAQSWEPRIDSGRPLRR